MSDIKGGFMAVRIIPAQPVTGSIRIETEPVKLRVAAYCRVSTEMEEQESSYEAQVKHYTSYIEGNGSWALAGIYADEGISGTGTRKREQFRKMIDACEKGEIDMIITKSISRFARNTLDCLKYIRLLKGLNIPILFEKENINTMDAKGELLITIMASIAQQESQSISQNVRMGIQYRFQQGRPMVQHNWFLGYTKERNGDLMIVPEEAVIVRRIYRDFLEGLSFGEIIQRLENDHIKTGAGRDKWYSSTIQSMLRNEKYMGDLLLQKGYTIDFLTKEKVRNNGEFPQYYVENAHEPIVPREVFMQVQGEFLRREYTRIHTGKREMHRSNLALNQRLVCSDCGSTYRRFAKQEGEGRTDWRCRRRIEKGTPCKGRIIQEKVLHDAVIHAFNALPVYRDELIRMHERIACLPLAQIREELQQVNQRIENIQNELSIYGETGSLSYEPVLPLQEEIQHLQNEIRDLNERKNALLERKAEYDIRQVQIASLLARIRSMTEPYSEAAGDDGQACSDYNDFFIRTEHTDHIGPIKEFNNDDVIRYIAKITVYDTYLIIAFKAGIEIRAEA